jgi:hypothetical protein
MRLRASGEHTGEVYDLQAVMTADIGSGIPEGELLNDFAEAICARDAEAIAAARAQIRSRLGDAALVDSAAVIAGFNAFPRVADATGIPLEDQKAEMTADLREELGLNALDTGRSG